MGCKAFLHCISLFFTSCHIITHVVGKPLLSTDYDHSFQDLSQAEFERDVQALRSGFAPIQVVNSRKNGNILSGFEQSWKEIRCSVQASPVAVFDWKYRGLSIDPDAAQYRDSVIIFSQNNLSILKVKIQESRIGEYSCRASNELGASERNFFLSRAAKPPTPEFDAIVLPNSGILIQVTGFHTHHRKTLHIIQTHGFKDKEELGEILPVKGYIVQIRKMKSCDQWRNITIYSEKKFLRHHLLPGTIYRMRLAAKTEGGIGEFSRAKTVNYMLQDRLGLEEQDEEQEKSTEKTVMEDAISSEIRSAEYSDEVSSTSSSTEISSAGENEES